MKFYDDIYIGRDNYLTRRIERADSGATINIRDLTRVTLEVLGMNPPVIVDSDEVGMDDVFDWETYGEMGLLGFRLGLIETLPTGFKVCKLILYSDSYPNGLDNLKPVYFNFVPLSNG